MIRPLLLALGVLPFSGKDEADSSGAPGYDSHLMLLGAPVLGLDLCDVDGDGMKELLLSRYAGLEVWSLQGETLAADALLYELRKGEQRTLVWCVAPSPHSTHSIYVIREEGEVALWSPARPGSSAGSPESPDGVDSSLLPITRQKGLQVPASVSAVQFARDLNDDGFTDLVLPRRDGLSLLFGADSRGGSVFPVENGPLVKHNVSVDLDIPRQVALPSRLSRSLNVAAFDAEDQNADGHADLIFRDQDRVMFFWTDANGNLPEQPTFEVDLEAIRDRLPEVTVGSLNPSNLFKALESQVSHEVKDFDGDGTADLMVRAGRKLSLFRGTEQGFDRSRAIQVLKTSGNLLAAFSADDNGDGRPDLCMLRIEDLSLSDLLLWLVAGGSLSLDLFAYHQESPGRFARRPSSQRSVTFSFPSLMSISSEMEAESDRFAESIERLPVYADLDGDGRRNDLVLLAEKRVLELYHNVALEPSRDETVAVAWREVLDRFDRKADGDDEIEIELSELFEWIPVARVDLRERLRPRSPARTLRLEELDKLVPQESDSAEITLFAGELNGDGRDDLMVLYGITNSGPFYLSVFQSR